jgi:hypothetical protein
MTLINIPEPLDHPERSNESESARDQNGATESAEAAQVHLDSAPSPLDASDIVSESAAGGATTLLQAASGLIDTRSARARRWNRLSSITVHNFKAIQEATIPLGDVTILVGPNGSEFGQRIG